MLVNKDDDCMGACQEGFSTKMQQWNHRFLGKHRETPVKTNDVYSPLQQRHKPICTVKESSQSTQFNYPCKQINEIGYYELNNRTQYGLLRTQQPRFTTIAKHW